MTGTITVAIAPGAERVRLLATTPTHDIMQAILGPPCMAHPRAAATLLEGLALWHQQRLNVVLSVDDVHNGHALCLYDALGYDRTLHYEVGLAAPERVLGGSRQSRTQRGLGSFRDLRKLGQEWIL